MANDLTSRRDFIHLTAALAAAAFLPGCTPTDSSTKQERRMIVRISRGTLDPARYDEVAERLSASQAQLIPAIKALSGNLSYYAGIDRASSSIVNVSVWDMLEHAKQMDSLAPMLALAGKFQKLGVQFERPIINYETLWTIPASS